MDVKKIADSYCALTTKQREHLRSVQEDSLFQHGNFKVAFSRIREIIDVGKRSQLVVLSGPTNVGKTTLMRALDKTLIEDARRNNLPLWGSAYIRLPSPANFRFDQGETHWRTLDALEEPLIERKVYYEDIREGAIPRRTLAQSRRSPTHRTMFRAVINRLRQGHPAIFFDEVGELPQSLKVTSLRESVNFFKQMADLGNTTTVLGGGPEIGPILWESGQLAARTKLVGIDPYLPSNSNDRKSFCSLLQLFEETLGSEYIVPGTFSEETCDTAMQLALGTFGFVVDTTVFASASMLVRRKGPLGWPQLENALQRRMAEIGTAVRREHDLWLAVKNENLRANFWGTAANVGFRDEVYALPSKGRNAKSEVKSPDKDEVLVEPPPGAAAPTMKIARKGIHPTVPTRKRLGEHS